MLKKSQEVNPAMFYLHLHLLMTIIISVPTVYKKLMFWFQICLDFRFNKVDIVKYPSLLVCINNAVIWFN